MVKFTTLPGITFYIINVRTGRMLSFAAIEMASQEISGLISAKIATPIIVVKNTPDGAKIIQIPSETDVKSIETTLSSN